MRKKVFDEDKAKATALNIFWAKGYAQTSMDDLLKSMNISRSSFYNTFGDKRALYMESLKNFSFAAQIASSVLTNNKPIEELLCDFFDISFSTNSQLNAQGCLFVNTILEQHGNDKELAERASHFINLIEKRIEQALLTAIDTEELKQNTDTQHLARYIITVYKGLRVASREGMNCSELKKVFTSSLAILDPHRNTN